MNNKLAIRILFLIIFTSESLLCFAESSLVQNIITQHIKNVRIPELSSGETSNFVNELYRMKNNEGDYKNKKISVALLDLNDVTTITNLMDRYTRTYRERDEVSSIITWSHNPRLIPLVATILYDKDERVRIPISDDEVTFSPSMRASIDILKLIINSDSFNSNVIAWAKSLDQGIPPEAYHLRANPKTLRQQVREWYSINSNHLANSEYVKTVPVNYKQN